MRGRGGASALRQNRDYSATRCDFVRRSGWRGCVEGCRYCLALDRGGGREIGEAFGGARMGVGRCCDGWNGGVGWGGGRGSAGGRAARVVAAQVAGGECRRGAGDRGGDGAGLGGGAAEGEGGLAGEHDPVPGGAGAQGEAGGGGDHDADADGGGGV